MSIVLAAHPPTVSWTIMACVSTQPRLQPLGDSVMRLYRAIRDGAEEDVKTRTVNVKMITWKSGYGSAQYNVYFP
jgi:hypothetical protein